MAPRPARRERRRRAARHGGVASSLEPILVRRRRRRPGRRTLESARGGCRSEVRAHLHAVCVGRWGRERGEGSRCGCGWLRGRQRGCLRGWLRGCGCARARGCAWVFVDVRECA
eukprot:1837667-Prymnesium_polylepis.1